MDINNIKRPGGFGPLSDSPTDTPIDSKRERSFADAQARIQEAGPAKPLGVIGQFSKSALDDPSKLEIMVRACVSELIDSRQSVTGALSTTDKQSMVDFLSADPLIRSRIEGYLRKVLV